MDFVIIDVNSPEWETAWDWLEKHPINSGIDEPSIARNPETGESWQYIGSYKKDNKLITEFRHRCHPLTGRIELLAYAHENFNEESIKKSFKV